MRMNKLHSVSIVLFSLAISLPALAEDATRLKSGKWECALDGTSPHFRSTRPYQLEISQSGNTSVSQVAVLSNAAGKRLVSTWIDGNYIAKEGDLLPAKKYGYSMIGDEARDLSSLTWIVAVREGDGVYQNEEFKCTAIGKPVITASKAIDFSCKTDEALIDGKIHEIDFGIVHLDDPETASVVSLHNDEEAVVRVSPSNPILESLNENLRLSVSRDRIEVRGDSAGILFVTLSLSKKSGYRQGYLRTSQQGDPEAGQYGRVTCKVKR